MCLNNGIMLDMIYFVQGERTGLVKIGKAEDVFKRLRSLQIGSPDILKILAVIEGETRDSIYHLRFKVDWVHGEWFRPSNDLMSFISQISLTKFSGFSCTARNKTAAPEYAPRSRTIKTGPLFNASGQKVCFKCFRVLTDVNASSCAVLYGGWCRNCRTHIKPNSD